MELLTHDKLIQVMIRDTLSHRSITGACSPHNWPCCVFQHVLVLNSVEDLMKLANIRVDSQQAL